MNKRVICLMGIIGAMLLAAAGCGKEEQKQTWVTTQSGEETTASIPQTIGEETTEITTVPEIFELNRSDITLISEGETLTLFEGSLDGITWGSEAPEIATFSDGVVTAVSGGNTTVWAERDGVRSQCAVYCNIKEPETTRETTPAATTGSGNSRSPVLQLPTVQNVTASFFDDAAFVGDSISLKLSNYAEESGALGNATFLVRGSYGVGNEVAAGYHIIYQGEEMVIEKALSLCGAKKVFIMLGMNDIALYGIDATIENWGKMISNIRSGCPDIEIYIQSMTPVWTGGEKGGLNNTNVDAYNVKLKAFAQSNGCGYIDVAPYMKDSTGGLATVYCSDSYVHLSTEGAKAWIAVLMAYTGY